MKIINVQFHDLFNLFLLLFYFILQFYLDINAFNPFQNHCIVVDCICPPPYSYYYE